MRWYCKYGISYRDLEEMAEERGLELDHSTIYRSGCLKSHSTQNSCLRKFATAP